MADGRSAGYQMNKNRLLQALMEMSGTAEGFLLVFLSVR